MNLDWILSPLALYAALALGLIASLALFFSAKLEMQAVRRSMSATIATLKAELEGIREGLGNLEMAPASAAPAEALNLTKRTQALRMHRRGEPTPSIAAAVRAPRNEIELMLKVQELTNPRSESQSRDR